MAPATVALSPGPCPLRSVHWLPAIGVLVGIIAIIIVGPDKRLVHIINFPSGRASVTPMLSSWLSIPRPQPTRIKRVSRVSPAVFCFRRGCRLNIIIFVMTWADFGQGARRRFDDTGNDWSSIRRYRCHDAQWPSSGSRDRIQGKSTRADVVVVSGWYPRWTFLPVPRDNSRRSYSFTTSAWPRTEIDT